MLNLLNDKVATLNELDLKIMETCTDEDSEKEISEASKYQNDAYLCLAAIQEALEKLRESPVLHTQETSQHDNDSASVHTNYSDRNRNIRLPKLSIPSFEDNPMNYQSFIDQFESSVNANENLSKVEKFFFDDS